MAAELAYSKNFDKALTRTGRPCVLMGHARYPTRGGVTLKDTHPHNIGHIVGMHNGTMSVVNGAVVSKEENDSRLLFECLQKEGLQTTLQRAVGEYALSWLDMKEGTINFYRNHGRPLWFAAFKGGGGTIWYASEPEYLYIILDKMYPGDKIEVSELPPFHHLAFKVPATSGNVHPFKFEKVIPQTSTSVPVVVKQGNALPDDGKDVTNPVKYITFHGQALYYDELIKALWKGCTVCEKPKDFSDYRQCKLKWYDREEFVCRECYETDPFARQVYDGYVAGTANTAH